MANSSDWIAQAQRAPDSGPSWLTAINARDGFAAGAVFGGEPLEQASSTSDAHPSPAGAPATEEDEFARGYAEGETAGRAAAKGEAETKIAQYRALRLAFRSFDQAALDALAAELSDTVIALCGQVLGDNAVSSNGLLARCETAATRLGAGAGESKLRLHPDDIDLLGDALSGWDAEADPTLERGALRLETTDGAVHDGPAEWRRAIAAAIKG